MPNDVKDKLQSRKDAIAKDFESLRAVREKHLEEGRKYQSEWQRKLNEVDAKLVQLQGAYQEVEGLLKEEPEAEVIPPKKK